MELKKQTSSEQDDKRTELLKLNAKREAIEKQMADIVEVLDHMKGQPGLRTPLVDYEGFPRDDVDIFETRKLRHQHACL